jgi:hypothetical protein
MKASWGVAEALTRIGARTRLGGGTQASSNHDRVTGGRDHKCRHREVAKAVSEYFLK